MDPATKITFYARVTFWMLVADLYCTIACALCLACMVVIEGPSFGQCLLAGNKLITKYQQSVVICGKMGSKYFILSQRHHSRNKALHCAQWVVCVMEDRMGPQERDALHNHSPLRPREKDPLSNNLEFPNRVYGNRFSEIYNPYG